MMRNPKGKPHRRRPVKPWVRQRRLLLAGMAVTLCALFLLIVSFKHFLNASAYQAQVDKLRSRGIPVTTKELQEWQETAFPEEHAPETSLSPNDDARATDLYQQAFEGLRRYEKEFSWPNLDGILKNFSQNGRLSPEELELLRSCIEENKAVLALLHQARPLPAGKFPLDYSTGVVLKLPHLSPIRQALSLLRAEALLAMLAGNADQVHDALMAGLAVTHPLRREPVFRSQFVRSANIGELLESMQEALGRVDFSDAQLSELQRTFETSFPRDILAKALVTERVFGLYFYEDPVRFLETIGPRPDDLLHRSYNTLIRTYNTFGGYAGELKYLLDYADAVEHKLKLPYPEAKDAQAQLRGLGEYQRFFPSAAKTLLWEFDYMPVLQALDETRHLQGATAAAIERYRRKHGTAPPGLDALTPGYLPDIPRDPFDLQPMRYRREGDGYVLYSVGEDGTDNNGARSDNPAEGDVVFRVKR